MAARRRRPMSEINVVPYIDVMLVLLVIFMATAPMLAQGIQLDLPKEASKPLERVEEDPLVISIRADGTMYLNLGGTEEDDMRVTKLVLQEQVMKILRVRPSVPIFVRGDEALPYGVVIEVMTILQEAGAESVGLITDPPAV